MTKSEKETLLCVARKIRYYASLKNASFSHNEEKDKDVKNSIRPYMCWLEICANDIEEIVEADNKDRFFKSSVLSDIRSSSHGCDV